MATVTLHHPSWPNVDVEVEESLAGDWTAAGWVAQDPPAGGYRERATVLAIPNPDGTYALKAYRGSTEVASLTRGGPIRNTVLILGTSLEAQNGDGAETLDPATGDLALHGRGWFHWANAYLGNPLHLVRNAGIGGNTYAQIKDRLDTDVLPHRSAWVFLGGPTNDTSTGRPATDVIADATTILDRLADRRILILTGPPNTGHTTEAERAALFEVNEWIRRLPQERDNVIVADAWRVLSNGTDVAPAAGLAIDGVHYSAAGAARVGKAAAEAVAPFIAPAPHRTSSAADPFSVLTNPALTDGTGWATLGTGVTAAYQADEDTATTSAVLTYSGVTSTGNLGIQATTAAAAGKWAPGDVVQASARVRWRDVTPLGVTSAFGPVLLLSFRAEDGTVAEHQWGFVPSNQNTIPTNAPKSGDAVVTTARHTIPTALASGSPVSQVEVRVGFRGISAGTVTVSDVAATRNN